MNHYNLIGIYLDNISTDMNVFAETGKYKTAVQVKYKINDDKLKNFYLKRPIVIFHKYMLYKDFESIVRNNNGNTEFMTMPGKAYLQMQRYISREVEKVLADMTMYVIVKILNNLPQRDYNVFFIDNRDSNKLIGRLGYMYLNNIKNIFCFVSYKTDSLMTDVLRNESDVLRFDIDYFNRPNVDDISIVIPNDPMDSLLQTVFYRMTANEEDLLPLRCDIFSQGNSTSEIKKKVEIIREITLNPKYMSIPFQYTKTSNKLIRIPTVLSECMNESIYTNSLSKILEET